MLAKGKTLNIWSKNTSSKLRVLTQGDIFPALPLETWVSAETQPGRGLLLVIVCMGNATARAHRLNYSNPGCSVLWVEEAGLVVQGANLVPAELPVLTKEVIRCWLKPGMTFISHPLQEPRPMAR